MVKHSMGRWGGMAALPCSALRRAGAGLQGKRAAGCWLQGLGYCALL